MKHLLYLYIIFFLPLSSCELTKEIDYNTENYIPKLITHGYISPQGGVQIILKTTTNPSNIIDNDKAINTEVLLYNDDGEYLKLKYENNYLFTSDSLSFIHKNKLYYIKAKADNFEPVYSKKQVILATPQIDSVKIVKRNKTYANIYFNNNYTDNVRFYLNVLPYNDGKIDSKYVNNEKFNPFSMLENINKGSNVVEFPANSFFEYDSLLVELYVLSKDLVQFLISQDNYDFSKEDPFYPQPYPVFSNITGGYGIFASYSFSCRVLNISRKWD